MGVLFLKLIRMGVEDIVVDWIISYLSLRSFRVRVNSSLSTPRACPSGVPQGSCLGPLLFCVFINDIGTVIPPSVTYKMYSDDLKMYSADIDSSSEHLQQAINSVSCWCELNGMLLSTPKCTVVGSSPNATPLTLNGAQLKKFLI